MTPIDYNLYVSITRRKSRHLKNVQYNLHHSANEISHTESQERVLLPGQIYRVCYDRGMLHSHTFKITAKTKYGEIESNEICVPDNCKEIAMEIITERGRGRKYTLKLVESSPYSALCAKSCGR